jgi:hypothetical protein
MTVGLLTRRYLDTYVRNPVNVLLLVTIPAVFVLAASGSFAKLADLIGNVTDRPALEANTAGWAAGFLVSVAAFNQMSGSRAADRRLALAGMRAPRMVFARLTSGLGLALLASAGALGALALRYGLHDPARTITGTLLYALIYLGIGTAVGAIVRDELNGSVVILFIWILDVFLGPTMTGRDLLATRWMPTHFTSLFMVGVPSGHGSPIGDLGWAAVWAIASLLGAALLFVATTRSAKTVRAARHTPSRLGIGVRFALREYRRNRALWALLVFVPAVFILAAVAVTPDDPRRVLLVEHGRSVTGVFSMIDIHAATMAAMAVGALAGIAGLSVVLDSRSGDRRLAIAGFPARELLARRAVVIATAAGVVTGVALAITAASFEPDRWATFALGTLLIALLYGLVGVLIGPLVGRVGGLYVMFMLPFIDLGVGQSVLTQPVPPGWAKLLPGYGPMKIVLDGAFTPTFDQWWALGLSLAWLFALSLAALVVFQRVMEPRRS